MSASSAVSLVPGKLRRRSFESVASVLDTRLAKSGSKCSIWNHLVRHAEFYSRNQDSWNLALDLGPASPTLEATRNTGCGLASRVLRCDGSLSSGGGKLLISLPCGMQIETAVIVSKMRPGELQGTICVSSQGGCAMACRFCDTGLIRQTSGGTGINLPEWAILEQVLHAEAWLQREGSQKVSNVVFMGMGEPLLNYGNVLGAARMLRASGHKVTLSTVGVAPQIRKLAKDAPQGLNLALSLHAPTQELREELLPVASRSWKLSEVLSAVRQFEEVTGTGVLIEYILIRDVNDGDEQAVALANLITEERIKCAGINLIPYNPTDAGAAHGYRPPSDLICKRFREQLRSLGAPNVTIRFSTKLGRSWSAACGQLGLNKLRQVKALPVRAPTCSSLAGFFFPQLGMGIEGCISKAIARHFPTVAASPRPL